MFIQKTFIIIVYLVFFLSQVLKISAPVSVLYASIMHNRMIQGHNKTENSGRGHRKQETADLVTFTEEILNGKLHLLCSGYYRKTLFESFNIQPTAIRQTEKSEFLGQFCFSFMFFLCQLLRVLVVYLWIIYMIVS